MKKNQRSKPKINRKGKSYDLDQCALYKLKGYSQLEKILGESLINLSKLVSDTNYLLLTKNELNEKIREIQYPNQALYKIHNRIANLICRIKTPIFLHSGTKNRSHVTNAKSHEGYHPILTLDIQRFYQSITKKSVFWFFHKKLEICSDIADFLAELCTYNGYIPTGSPLSMNLAYWVSSDMFDHLNNFSKNNNVTMTVYVDDLTFSGIGVNTIFKNNIIRLIESCGYKVNSKKTRLSKITAPKIVTGCVLKKGSVYLRNKHHKKINSLKKSLEDDNLTKKDRDAIERQLLGHLSSAAQINKKYIDIGKQYKKIKNRYLVLNT